MVHGRDRNAVVIRPHVRIAAHDHVRQVRRAFGVFPVHDEVLPVLDALRLDPVVLEPPRPRPHGLGLVDHLPERHARIGPHHHEPPLLRLQHRLGVVAIERGGGIKQPLDVHVHLVLVHELPLISLLLVARHLRELRGHHRVAVQVVARVVQRPDAALPDLHVRIRAGRGHLRIRELHPRVNGKGHVRVVHAHRHLQVLDHDALDVRVHVLDHVVVVLRVVQMVVVDRPQDLRRRRHVGLAREHPAPVLRRVDDQAAVAVVPVRRLLAVIVVFGMDGLAVRRGVQI